MIKFSTTDIKINAFLSYMIIFSTVVVVVVVVVCSSKFLPHKEELSYFPCLRPFVSAFTPILLSAS